MIGTQKFHIIPKLSWQNIYIRDCGEPMIITLNKIANLYIYIYIYIYKTFMGHKKIIICGG